jgi:ATP adenylyltransferase
MDRLWTPWRYNYVSRAEPETRKGVPAELADWPMAQDRHCVFCNLAGAAEYAIAQGMERARALLAARIVHWAKRCFICLNAFPYGSGHLLIVPFDHRASLAQLPEETALEMMRLARLSEEVLRLTYRPEGLNFGMNLGESAGAGVADHLHLHVLPRWTGDTNFMTVVGETRVLPEALETTWAKMEQAFAARAAFAEQASSNVDRKA